METTNPKTTPPAAETSDSGYISQPLDSTELSSPHPLTTSTTSTHSSSHLKTASTTSSGYYSRLDSTDHSTHSTLSTLTTHPWQYYVTPPTTSEHTPLHEAIVTKNTELLSKILPLLPHPSVLNVQTDSSRQSPLHFAVLTNQIEVVRLLVLSGASLEVRDSNGDTPVHVACRWGFGGCLEALVLPVEGGVGGVGGPVNSLGKVLELRNYEGLSPLHLATLSYTPSSAPPTTPPTNPTTPCLTPLHTLLFMATPTSTTDGKSGRTSLHFAIEKRDLAALRLLLEYSTRETMEIENYAGMSAYTLASCNLLSEFCHVLSEFGAEVLDYFSDVDDAESSADEE